MADKKKQSKNKKDLNISAVGIVDNIVYSDTDCWAYYKLTNDVFDFLSHQQKFALGVQLTNAFGALMTGKDEPLECHLIVTSVPVDIDNWEEKIREMAINNAKPSPGFDLFVQEQVEHLKEQDFLKKVTYLGINLGKRGALNFSGLNVLEAGIKGAKETLSTWLSTAINAPKGEISAKEEQIFREREDNYYRILKSGNLQATRPTSTELLMYQKRQFFPRIPTPPLISDYENRVGAGDIVKETTHAIENKYRWLKFIQMYRNIELEGYRATLSFAEFPKKTYYPMTFPFMYYPSKLGAPFTMYARFLLIPTSKMKSQVEKKKKEQKDELENVTTGQDEYSAAIDGLNPGTMQAIQDLKEIDSIISDDKMPWVEGIYNIIVEADDEEMLKDFCDTLIQSYDDLGIKIKHLAGNQKDLLLESLLADEIRDKTFMQTTTLSMISTAGGNFSSEVGDDTLLEVKN